MKVYFRTNLDKYQSIFYTVELDIIPRIGETVLIKKSLRKHFESQKLPTRLKVVDVVYDVLVDEEWEKIVIVELWYNKTDLELMKLNNINPF